LSIDAWVDLIQVLNPIGPDVVNWPPPVVHFCWRARLSCRYEVL